MPERTVHIPSITCDHCTRTIKLELEELNGVTTVEADAETKKATIVWGDPADWDTIEETLEEIGFAPE